MTDIKLVEALHAAMSARDLEAQPSPGPSTRR